MWRSRQNSKKRCKIAEISSEKEHEQVGLSGESDPQETGQTTETWPCWEIVNVQTRSLSWIIRHRIFGEFEIKTDHTIPIRKPDLVVNYITKTQTSQLMDFTVRADH